MHSDASLPWFGEANSCDAGAFDCVPGAKDRMPETTPGSCSTWRLVASCSLIVMPFVPSSDALAPSSFLLLNSNALCS